METTFKGRDYLSDPHLNRNVKDFLTTLNTSGAPPLESLDPYDAKKILEDAQSSAEVDYSGIDEYKKTIDTDGFSIELVIVKPKGNTEIQPAFIFIHGGGWVLGDYPTHKRLIRDLVVLSGYPAVYVNYTRTPDAKFPQALNEIYAAVNWISKNGSEINIDGNNLAIVGNSVGGNMTAVTTLKSIEGNEPKFKGLVLLWPLTDASMEHESYKLYGNDRFLTSSVMKWMFDMYSTDPEELSSKYISVLNAQPGDLQNFPPTLIVVAENDILRDEGEAFGRKLGEAGVDVTTTRYNGTIHDFGLLNGLAYDTTTQAMIRQAATEIKKYLS
jgi:acetyl esterase